MRNKKINYKKKSYHLSSILFEILCLVKVSQDQHAAVHTVSEKNKSNLS